MQNFELKSFASKKKILIRAQVGLEPAIKLP